jgi:hypothetical protein
MAQYRFELDSIQTRWAFVPIRSKYDFAEILLQAIKVMLTPTNPPEEQVASRLTLHIAKMSRLFFSTPKKIFSINFPFVANVKADGLLSFSSHAHPKIDERATSIALGLLTDIRRPGVSVFDLATYVEEATAVDPHAWELLLELLTVEDGYIRYDDDAERASGHRHPQHHIDVFYSNQTTFKLGLLTRSTNEDLLDMLDVLTDCHFVARRTTAARR